ncbi:MAG: SEC-C domain-containing protein, partial [Candidatus Hydrogenedentes bacterium]|nr:SEC-C domain-containing protein [Candidatus Hydrogenedentota bacterium]
RKRRHMVESRSQEPMQDDPFQQLSQYSYIAADKQQDRSFASFDTSRFALAGQAAAGREEEEGGVATEARPKPAPIRNLGPQTGPNDPCTCGSGKKYKKCCGKLG